MSQGCDLCTQETGPSPFKLTKATLWGIDLGSYPEGQRNPPLAHARALQGSSQTLRHVHIFSWTTEREKLSQWWGRGWEWGAQITPILCTWRNRGKIQAAPSPGPALPPALQVGRCLGCPLPSTLAWLPGTSSLGGATGPWVTFGISDLCLLSLAPPLFLRAPGQEQGARWGGGSQSLPNPLSTSPSVFLSVCTSLLEIKATLPGAS